MPVMLRTSKKATKIAYKILGTPPSMIHPESKTKKKINQRLVFEETIRVR